MVRGGEHAYEERPNREGESPRLAADVTSAAWLKESDEVFVVLSGTLTMLLGEPPERFDLPPESVVSVEPRTPLQLRNETGEEVVLFAYGAPPEPGRDDVEL